MSITVRYSAVDGARITRKFKTLKGAGEFATSYVGDFPSIGSGYAVSDDGVGKVTVSGCTLQDLFFGWREMTGDPRLGPCEPYRTPAERRSEEARLARIVPADPLEDIFADFIAQERGIPSDM